MFGVLVIVQRTPSRSAILLVSDGNWWFSTEHQPTSNNPQQFRNVVSFSFAGYRQRRGGIVGGMPAILSHSLGLDDQSFIGSALLHAHSFNGFLHADRHLRAVDRFDLIAVQQATKPFCAQRERRSLVF